MAKNKLTLEAAHKELYSLAQGLSLKAEICQHTGNKIPAPLLTDFGRLKVLVELITDHLHADIDNTVA